MAKLQTYLALSSLRTYLEAEHPARVAQLGITSRIQDYLIGRRDPEALTAYDAALIATIPERLGPLGDELTVTIPLDILFAVLGSTEDEVIERQIAYGDALVNLVNEGRQLGGAVFGSTVFNPEILMPAPGSKQVGLTIVRLHIELNLLGG